jgi:hypothetical protein
MTEQIPPQCAPIASELETLEEDRASLQQDLAEPGLPAYVRTLLLREIRTITLDIARKRQELQACLQQYPPPPLPDLVAETVVLHVNHPDRKLGVAAFISNVGQGNAIGPFRIDLAATLVRGGVTTSYVQSFSVPPGFIIFGVPVIESAAPITGGITPSSNYVTEQMEVPLYYRDETPSSIYEFDYIVDAEQVIAETNKGNNHFFSRWWTITPAVALQGTPLVIKSSGD